MCGKKNNIPDELSENKCWKPRYDTDAKEPKPFIATSASVIGNMMRKCVGFEIYMAVLLKIQVL
jgi:hypothetical protein